jgi:hypothetical protein
MTQQSFQILDQMKKKNFFFTFHMTNIHCYMVKATHYIWSRRAAKRHDVENNLNPYSNSQGDEEHHSKKCYFVPYKYAYVGS